MEGMPALTRESVSSEALFILKNLRENARLGRSNRLGEVKGALEPAVSLEFDSYFFFLRKFHYLTMDREARLELTEGGERVVSGEDAERFTGEVTKFFADQIGSLDEVTAGLASAAAAGGAVGLSTVPEVHFEEHLPPPPPPPAAFVPTPRRRFSPAPPIEERDREARAGGTARVEVPDLRGGGAAVRGQDLDQRYVKFEALGSGSLGTVYKGRHNALAMDVAVKELKDIFGYFSFLQRGEVIKRLRRELCAQAQVRHPGVLPVLDQNTDVARPYFVCELGHGSLRERLNAAAAAGRPMPVGETLRVFLQLAYALRAAHRAGLTHHNVKPENVLFDAWGNAKLGDFGLGRVIEVDAAKGMPQVIVGTGGMAYMAPELLARQRDAGAAADVYALGILLYELLTGAIPGRRSPLPSEANPEVPKALDAIFDRMPHDRPESIDVVNRTHRQVRLMFSIVMR